MCVCRFHAFAFNMNKKDLEVYLYRTEASMLRRICGLKLKERKRKAKIGDWNCQFDYQEKQTKMFWTF